jgi:hypothetical protein
MTTQPRPRNRLINHRGDELDFLLHAFREFLNPPRQRRADTETLS